MLFGLIYCKLGLTSV